MKYLLILLFLTFSFNATADEATGYLSVEENLIRMDINKDGMVTSDEVSQYARIVQGHDLNKSTLEKLSAMTDNKSCASPFSRSFY